MKILGTKPPSGPHGLARMWVMTLPSMNSRSSLGSCSPALPGIRRRGLESCPEPWTFVMTDLHTTTTDSHCENPPAPDSTPSTHSTASKPSNGPTGFADTTAPSAPMVCLHVGCGSRNATALHESFRGADWTEVRLDVDPSVEPDIVASITDLSMINAQSVDSVFSSHNLEHLEAHEVPMALGEFHRVLRPGGILLITMPNLMEVAKRIVDDQLEEAVYESPAGPVAPLDMLYGFRPYIARGASSMAHRTGFTPKSLRAHLRNAGFGDGKVWSEGFDLWAMAIRTEGA